MKIALLCVMLAFGSVSALAAVMSDTAVTPEPATMALLGAGLAGVGVAAWRHNRRK